MTPENERLVRQSWKQFEPMAVASAAFFYEKLFELDPDARRLFARTDMEAQGQKVMHMFAEIVRSLDQPEKLVPEVADPASAVRDAWTEAYLLCAIILRRGAAQEVESPQHR